MQRYNLAPELICLCLSRKFWKKEEKHFQKNLKNNQRQICTSFTHSCKASYRNDISVLCKKKSMANMEFKNVFWEHYFFYGAHTMSFLYETLHVCIKLGKVCLCFFPEFLNCFTIVLGFFFNQAEPCVLGSQCSLQSHHATSISITMDQVALLNLSETP